MRQVSPLPRRVERGEGEPAYAMLVRTLEHNGARRTYTALNRVTGGKGGTVNNFDVGEVARLCKADPVALAHATPDVGSKTATVMGQTVAAGHVGTRSRRWCPACLAESPHHRVWWDLLPVTTCPLHGIELASSCGCKGRPLQWRSHPTLSCGRGHVLSRVTCDEARPDAIALDAYVIGRLRGAAGPVHLDGTPLGDVLTVAERLGKASIDESAGIFALRKSLPAGRLHAEGFRILNGLPDAFAEVLERLQAEQEARPGKFGVRKAYGYLYTFIRELPDHPVGIALKGILADQAHRNVVIFTGTKLDGRTRYVNEGYCVRDAARELGLQAPRLVDILERLGLPTEGRGVRSEISAETFETVKARLAGTRSLTETSAELGLTQLDVAGLSAAGLLDMVVPGEGTASWLFPSDAASVLLRRLRSKVSGTGRMPIGFMTLPRAAKSNRASVAEVIALVIDGKLAVRTGRASRFATSSFWVDPREIPRHLERPEVVGVALSTAAEELGLTLKRMNGVVEAGLLQTLVVDGLVRVPEAEILRFRETWATMRELKAAMGASSLMAVTELLARAGVEPVVIRGNRLFDLFYPRKEALAACEGASTCAPERPGTDWSRKALAAAMRISLLMVRQLVEARLIGMRQVSILGDVPEEEVERVRRTYASGAELAEAFGLPNGKSALSVLRKVGVNPVCGRPAFDAYLFARDEAEEALRLWKKSSEEARADREDDVPTLSVAELAVALSTGPHMAQQLIAGGFIAAKRKHPRTEVAVAEVERFRDRYILSNEVARLAGLSQRHGLGRTVTHSLVKNGVQPVCAPPAFVNCVFEREAAVAAIGRIFS